MPVSKKRNKKGPKPRTPKEDGTKRNSVFTNKVRELSKKKCMVVMAYMMYGLIIFGAIALAVMAFQH